MSSDAVGGDSMWRKAHRKLFAEILSIVGRDRVSEVFDHGKTVDEWREIFDANPEIDSPGLNWWADFHSVIRPIFEDAGPHSVVTSLLRGRPWGVPQTVCLLKELARQIASESD